MCGIVAVIRRPCRRPPPSGEDLLSSLGAATIAADVALLERAATAVEDVDRALRGVAGVRALLADTTLPARVESRCEQLERAVAGVLRERTADRLFRSMAVRTAGPNLAFVYKAAAEIGELGDNTRHLRDAVRADELLRLALRAPSARATVLGHTRWASVGIIS